MARKVSKERSYRVLEWTDRERQLLHDHGEVTAASPGQAREKIFNVLARSTPIPSASDPPKPTALVAIRTDEFREDEFTIETDVKVVSAAAKARAARRAPQTEKLPV